MVTATLQHSVKFGRCDRDFLGAWSVTWTSLVLSLDRANGEPYNILLSFINGFHEKDSMSLAISG